MSICSPFPNLNSAADVIESNNLQQMTFSSKASCKRSLVLLVTWNLIIVSGPCNIYAKANYGIYFHSWQPTILQDAESMQNVTQDHKILH